MRLYTVTVEEVHGGKGNYYAAVRLGEVRRTRCGKTATEAIVLSVAEAMGVHGVGITDESVACNGSVQVVLTLRLGEKEAEGLAVADDNGDGLFAVTAAAAVDACDSLLYD